MQLKSYALDGLIIASTYLAAIWAQADKPMSADSWTIVTLGLGTLLIKTIGEYYTKHDEVASDLRQLRAEVAIYRSRFTSSQSPPSSSIAPSVENLERRS